MLRHVLLALDSTDASRFAQRAAIRFCRERTERLGGSVPPVQLTATAVVDRPELAHREPRPIGTGAIKHERDEAMVARAQESAARVLSEFETACRKAGVPFDTITTEGLPYAAIEAVARRHDLIMIGQDTNFHAEINAVPGETVKRIVQDHPRPVIVTSDQPLEQRGVAVAYDGSLQASRSLYVYTHLDLFVPGVPVHIVSVHRDEATAAAQCEDAAAFLHRHDVYAETHPVVSGEPVSVALMRTLEPLAVSLIVAGAYGRGGLKAKFFGSVTQAIMNASKQSLFLYR